ncbi:Peroxiredoxin [Granulibacter bethesdensis]|nr:Peroxiredoxin [Granulibacter bethesdensis CGDNIH4]APH52639.1 Peroxiredoxin [Granulibacter bethesdensis]APH60213.1 Peroxiredoxin [Granulibacter bethesdensis]
MKAGMTIKTGDVFPAIKIMASTPDGPKEVETGTLFADKKVVLFAVPGAFTPTCSAKHLPGYLNALEAFQQKGVDIIACLSVNDPFVMGAWAKEQGVEERILMLADGSAVLTRALGLELDLTARGLGVRSQRFAMVVEKGVVTHLAIEPPGGFDVSRAEQILAVL